MATRRKTVFHKKWKFAGMEFECKVEKDIKEKKIEGGK